MTFSERFLKAKHWQLFLLSFVLPMILIGILWANMIGSILGAVASKSEPDPYVFFGYFKYIPLIIIISAVTHYGWFWAVANGLQSKVPAGVKMKVKKFRIFFFFLVFYLLLVCVFITLMTESLPGMIDQCPEHPNPNAFVGVIGAMLIMIPFHFFSMFCTFYSIYFVAKTFKTVELQRETNFSDFVGEFFLVWFYPVGVWMLQPKINQMV
jgi:hypothetical protein